MQLAKFIGRLDTTPVLRPALSCSYSGGSRAIRAPPLQRAQSTSYLSGTCHTLLSAVHTLTDT